MSQSNCTVPVADLECLFMDLAYAEAQNILFGTSCDSDIDKIEALLLAAETACLDCQCCNITNAANDLLYKNMYESPVTCTKFVQANITVVPVQKTTGKLPNNNVIPYDRC